MEENQLLKYQNDQRDKETILRQSQIVNKLCDKNKLAFEQLINEELTLNDLDGKQNKEKVVIERMDFKDGRYVEYRDNLNNQSQFEMKDKVIILIQGIPGGVKYYGKLESVVGNNFCRVINFYIPGLDKKDERRGEYQGSMQDLLNLIDDFMVNLQIERAVFVAHSIGGLVCKCFASEKPSKVEALVQIATAPITKWNGMRLYEGVDKKFYEIDDSITREQMFSDSFRNRLMEIHAQNRDKTKSLLPQDEQQLLGPIIEFSFLDTINFLKLTKSYPGKLNEILYKMRQADRKIPRMFVYSSQDQLMQAQLQEEEIYLFVLGDHSIKRRITKQVNEKVKLDSSNFNSNYLFRFDDATHIVQHEKGREIGVLLKHFIRQLQFTEIIEPQSPRL